MEILNLSKYERYLAEQHKIRLREFDLKEMLGSIQSEGQIYSEVILIQVLYEGAIQKCQLRVLPDTPWDGETERRKRADTPSS